MIKVLLILVLAFLCFAAIVRLTLFILERIKKRMIATGKLPQMEVYHLSDKEWRPTFHLEHCGVTLFHLPFVPDIHEVFYLENEYDEYANSFIRENKALITERLAEKGFQFIYLPDQHFPQKDLLRYVLYRNPSLTEEEAKQLISDTPQLQSSSMLLDYMVFPSNRRNIKPCFAWVARGERTHHDSNRITKYIFDYISFDGQEAFDSPTKVMDEICQEIGKSKRWINGFARTQLRNLEEEEPDERFDYDIYQLLEEVKEKVNALRIKGVSEAIISQYVRRNDTPSRLLITDDLRIFLLDYQNKEVKLEPLNKAVFLFFLRHEEGFRFKELIDHVQELSAIYLSIKQKKNEIEVLMQSRIQVPSNITELANPLSNSINEKCTRIKEAFLLLMHDDLASYYYINGTRSERKRIKLPRHLVIWEGGDK